MHWAKAKHSQYHRHIIDSEGHILETTVIKPRTGHESLKGMRIVDLLDWTSTIKLMSILKICIKSKRILFCNYHIKKNRFVAAMDYIDSETIYIHELLWPDSISQKKIIQQLMQWVETI